MSALVIGCDPGLTGALAIVAGDGTFECVHDLPVIRDGRLSWIDGGQLQSLLLDAIRGRTARAMQGREPAPRPSTSARAARPRNAP